ncbi:MAG: pyruvate dehydrogenase (acetyl-transferring) E1 component subunit alpha, partial [Hyphomicrobiales bacterium]
MAARKTKAGAPAKAAAKAPAKSASKGATKTLSNVPTFNKDEDLHAYREMLLIRRFEEKAGQMYGMGLIGGFC